MKTAILTDSGSALHIDRLQKKGLYLVPLQVIDEELAYRDGVDMTTMQLYECLEKNHTPKTSMPVSHDINDVLLQIKKDGYEHVIAVPLSSGLSGTYNAMRICAEEIGIPLTLVETYTTCNLEGHAALSALQYAEEGKTPSEIVSLVEEKVQMSGTIILPNDIQHLKRGGRLTPIAAAAASMLKIKPILVIDPSTKGKIDVYDKVRTERKAMDVAVSYIIKKIKDKQGYVYIIHSNNLERAKQVEQLIKKACPQVEIEIDYISAVISAHTGLDCVAIQYIEK